MGVAASIGTVGDSYDNAMAESMMGIFKTELYRNPAVLADNGGHWKGLDDLEIATCTWVAWFNEERLHSELDDQTPAEFEATTVTNLKPMRHEKPINEPPETQSDSSPRTAHRPAWPRSSRRWNPAWCT